MYTSKLYRAVQILVVHKVTDFIASCQHCTEVKNAEPVPVFTCTEMLEGLCNWMNVSRNRQRLYQAVHNCTELYRTTLDLTCTIWPKSNFGFVLIMWLWEQLYHLFELCHNHLLTVTVITLSESGRWMQYWDGFLDFIYSSQ